MSNNIVNKRASGQRPKKRKRNRFHGNQYGKNDDSSYISASGRKLKNSSVGETDCDSNGTFEGYAVIDKSLLFTALEQCLCCSICHDKITITSETVYGLLIQISVSCDTCGEICTVKNSEMVGKKENASDINRRFILAMRCIGRGLAESKTFCGIMDLPAPVTQKSYDKIVSHLHAATHTVATNSMRNAVEEETKLTGSADLTVSGDGTWKTRGHSSRFGATSIIGSETGKVIDCFVASSYCKGCETAKDMTTKESLLKWKTKHETVCNKNHSGSSALMEVNGMVDMFCRSEEKYDVRYVNYIGDGDCKTFLAITNNNPYTVPVAKIECIGHVQKRMSTRLRKLKNDFRGKKLIDKKPLSGKGRLTDVLIDQLTTYYGNAIRKHSDNVRDMQRAVWAIWYHKRSNDDKIMHDFCPDGNDTWCPYRKAVANGTHDDFKHTKSIPVAIMDVIKPVFKDLSHPDLLKKCIGGRTQNVNESLNALIWSYCPKTTSSGKKIVEIAVNAAVANFNDGKQSVLCIMRELNLIPGAEAVAYAAAADKSRIKAAEKRAMSYSLEARIAKRRKEKTDCENNRLKEGLVYASGEF